MPEQSFHDSPSSHVARRPDSARRRIERGESWKDCSGTVLLLAALGGAAGCGGDGHDRPTRPPSALLVTLDTTIPEALHCYGAREGVSPHLDALAAEGLLFENARTVAPITLPAHASILTGLYPVRHSVRMNGSMVLPAAAATLAERAREKGYRTAAFVAAIVLDAEFGLAQGFETYDDPETPRDETALVAPSRRAAEVADRAGRWIAGLAPEEPFLAWVHFFDPHAPYEPPPEYLEAHDNPYRGEVAYMDAEIGRVFAALREAGRWDDTIVVAAGDHGEGLGRHGEGTHAAFAFDSTLDVPLIVRLPFGQRAGERVRSPVSLVDIHPTLVRMLGLGAPGDVDGRDLLAPDLDPARGVYFETYFGQISFGWSQIAGWADSRGKLIFSSSPEFYDLEADPREERDVIAARRDDVPRYRAAIDRLARLPRLAPHGREADSSAGLAAGIEKLGYAGLGATTALPEPLASLSAPSPHSRIRAHEAFLEAQRLCEAGRHELAVPILARIWSEEPANHNASFLLGTSYLAVDRPADALAPLRATIANRGADWIGGWLNLAVAHDHLGEREEAIAAFERALAGVVGPPGYMERLVTLLREAGDEEKARRYEARLIEAGRGSR
ncbi:MAG: sulfatase-like hydrolase/transferase [Planctomycetota bacterium]